MPSIDYSHFRNSVKSITAYYSLLVQETKNKRQVGSTNEWVLDNYYMISEQEKVLKVDLQSRSFRSLSRQRCDTIAALLAGFLEKTYYQVDKQLLFRYLSSCQQRTKDYFSFVEVSLLLPLLKCQLLARLASLCRDLQAKGSYKKPIGEVGNEQEMEQAAADNMLMMNIFNSLKKVSKIESSEVFHFVSFSERVLCAEKAQMYPRMYDQTKTDYRNRIVRLAKRSGLSEYDLVSRMVAEADKHGEHVGWQIFPPKRWNLRAHLYVIIVAACSLVLSALLACIGNEPLPLAIVACLLLLVPMSQLVIDTFNQLLYRIHKPMGTFKLKFKDNKIPEEYATMVIMPTILKTPEKARQMLEQLEVYFLSNGAVDNLYFTLVGDASAQDSKEMPFDDDIAHAGMDKAAELNEKYGRKIFFFVYRNRFYSEGEGCWLGFERKRGAILHFNDLLLGNLSRGQRNSLFRCQTLFEGDSTGSLPGNGLASTPPRITFVITLDTDTELVLFSAQKLIGAMAHPLNRAVLSHDGQRVVSGYGIMQPRVNVDVEVTNKSRYAQLFAGLGGLDVYTTASFELYQDIFNEGSFCGKGIYDLRVFQSVLKGAFPQNLILSHDLIEGCHIRCGLINDVELFDDNPSNYLDDAKRHHRWTRGDWQIVSWLGNTVCNEQGQRVPNRVNALGRWKIFDNLRRSVLSLGLLLLIFFGFALGHLNPLWYLLVVLAVVATPLVFFIVGKVRLLPHFNRQYKYYALLLRGFVVVLYKAFIAFALIPKEALMYTDAIVRSCYRMVFSHRNLLNWVPSDEASKSTKGTLADYLAKFWFNFVAAFLLLAVAALRFYLGDWPLMPSYFVAVAFTAVAWCVAPVLMHFLGRKFPQYDRHLNDDEVAQVRQWAADTWHFFDTFITEETHFLIPDNYQLNRAEKCDYKTSPTNIGYSITAVISAYQLHFIEVGQALNRLENIIRTVVSLDKWNGHLYNWYHVHSLKVLPNYFVSTADSGNFVACLYTLKGFLMHCLDADHHLLNNDQYQQAQSLLSTTVRLIDHTDFTKLYNYELDVFSIGFDTCSNALLPYNYNNFASEARLTSFLTIAKGDAPFKHWFCLDKTLVQYRRYKGVASWYGTMFEYFMPLIFLPTFKHTLMDETYSFAILAQRAFIKNQLRNAKNSLPWGISETAYHELDDAQNYKYHAFGVPYLKFQNTTPDRIVISPYSSLLAISVDDRAVFDNMRSFQRLDMMDEFGFFESYDEEDHTPVQAHYAHHQGMILASLANYLTNNSLQHFFASDPQMMAKEALLKEKVQVRPYIDLKVTRYKRYQYDKTHTESDAREYSSIDKVPEIGILSNGSYTILLNDRGSGFSRFHGVQLNRYRKVASEHYGQYLYIRDLTHDRLWCNTYAPLSVTPEAYHVVFASDNIKYYRKDFGIVTQTEITVAKDFNAEIRRFTFENHSGGDVDLELTSYGEVILCPRQADDSHRVFNGMTIASEFDRDNEALIFSKPAREHVDATYFMVHKLFLNTSVSDAEGHNPCTEAPLQYETSRLRFLGRAGSTQHAAVIEGHRTLSGTVGTTLDPIMSMRRRLHLSAGAKAEAFLIVGFGKSREQVINIVQQYHDAFSIANAFEMATVFSNMRTAMSLLKGSQMYLYNNIAKFLLQSTYYSERRMDLIRQNTLAQSGLWRFGVSGDLAILLLEIDNLDSFSFAKELLQAFEYYKVRGMHLDLVFINDEKGDRRDKLARNIYDLANLEHLGFVTNAVGKVYVVNGSDLSAAERILFRTVASIALTTVGGLSLEDQLARYEAECEPQDDKKQYPVRKALSTSGHPFSNLQYYNQYGGFSADGSEYVVTNTNTPMPWVNVLSNPHFGAVVSSVMSGFTFAHNAQQFKLTAWSNDIVRDAPSEMLLIDRKQFVPSIARHGQGYSTFEADYDDLKVVATVFVSANENVKYYLIEVTNKQQYQRTLRFDMVYKLVLGFTEENTARYLYSDWSPSDNTLFVRNVYHETYRSSQVALTASEPITEANIVAANRKSLTVNLSLAPAATSRFAYVIAVVENGDTSSHPQFDHTRFTVPMVQQQLQQVRDFWHQHLSYVQVETPDRSFDFMVNHWYLYQVYSARLFARAGFYQVGGATGFRDQLQDVMGILYSDPDYARRQILDHAAHQFPEGDVLHWWHESLLLGARTTFSDDYLWLVFVTYQYVNVTGDNSILAERVPFCIGEQLKPGEAERGIRYQRGVMPQDDDARLSVPTLYDHLCLCMHRALSRRGAHGLPLMGCGDWNDGMSRVGVQGKGESVWVAFFILDLIPKMIDITNRVDQSSIDQSLIPALHQGRSELVAALQNNAWDGAWFLRAYFDNGDPMGTRNNTECQIDLISQAWSILTDVATPEQKSSIFKECEARLVNREHEIIQLLSPSFKHSANHPGYIMDYPRGVRENGGQYTHGAMWYIMALLKEGRYDQAYFYYSIINPIHRTSTLADVLKYKVEPYCIAADIYSNRQHAGRGGWTWYTGSASWAYKTAVENILGLRKKGDTITLNPRVPSNWTNFTIHYRFGSSLYHLHLRRGVSDANLLSFKLVDDGAEHSLDLQW